MALLSGTSLLAMLVTSMALAANVHLAGGRRAEPDFLVDGLTLSASGKLVGLGRGDLLVTLTATGLPRVTCTNVGGSFPPGRNPPRLVLSGNQRIAAEELEKGGSVQFSVTTVAPERAVPGAPDCMGGAGTWSETIVGIGFSEYAIAVRQDADGNGEFSPEEVVLILD